MSTQKDKFEKMFEEALRDHEMPYDEQAWNAVNDKIVKRGLRNSGYSAGLVAAATIGVLITVAASVYLFTPDATDNDHPQKEHSVQQNDGEPNTILPIVKNEHEKIENTTPSNEVENIIPEEKSDGIDQADPSLAEEQKNAKNKLPKLNNDEAYIAEHNDGKADQDNKDPLDDQDPVYNDQSNSNQDDQDNNNPANDSESSINVDIIISSHEVCQGETVTLSANSSQADLNYQWIYNGSVSTGKEASFILKRAGSQSITLIALRQQKEVYKEEVDITVHATPDVEIVTTPPSNKTVPRYTFELKEYTDIKDLSWQIENVTVKDQKAKHLFRKKGDYNIVASVVSYNGCSNTGTTTINIQSNYNLLAPNALVINDPDYQRRTFIPAALKVMDQPFEMLIYDRGNKLIYQTSSADQPWTGIDQNNNQIAPADAYVWMVKLTTKEGKEEIYYGSVTLIK